jgi:hypothetical protein
LNILFFGRLSLSVLHFHLVSFSQICQCLQLRNGETRLTELETKGEQMKHSAAKQRSFGTCRYERTAPPKGHLSPETKVLNIELSLDEALKLHVAIDHCIKRVRKFEENGQVGRRAAVNMAVHLNTQKIAVTEAKLLAIQSMVFGA